MSWVIDSRLILELWASGRERIYLSDSGYGTSDMVTSVTITPWVDRQTARTQLCKYSIHGNSTTGGMKAEFEGGGNPWQVPVEVGHPRRQCPKSKWRAPEVIRGNPVTASQRRVIVRAQTHARHTGRIRKGYIKPYRICHPEWHHA